MAINLEGVYLLTYEIGGSQHGSAYKLGIQITPHLDPANAVLQGAPPIKADKVTVWSEEQNGDKLITTQSQVATRASFAVLACQPGLKNTEMYGQMGIAYLLPSLSSSIEGTSGGLAYAIQLYSRLVQIQDISSPAFQRIASSIIGATGDIDALGNIKPVRGIREKLLGLIDQLEDAGEQPLQNVYFLFPKACVKDFHIDTDLQTLLDQFRIRVCPVETLGQALEFLVGDAYQGINKSQSPYRGLSAFGFEHADRYFGFEEKVIQVSQLMAEHETFQNKSRILIVHGDSGLGKSSFVQAGLLPKLIGSQLYKESSCVIKPSACTEGKLSEFLISKLPLIDSDYFDAVNPQSAAWILSLEDSIDSYLSLYKSHHQKAKFSTDKPKLTIVIDQAEELLTHEPIHNNPEQLKQFVAILKYLSVAHQTHDLISIWVIFTIRSDALTKLIAQLDLTGNESIVAAFPLTLPDTSNLLAYSQIISKPAQSIGMEVEEALVRELMPEIRLAENPLPLLEYTLDELFRFNNKAESSDIDILTLDQYQKLGAMSGLLIKNAQALYESHCQDNKQEAFEALLEKLITVPKEDQVLYSKVADQESLKSNPFMSDILDQWINARLISVQEGKVRFAHEVLIHGWHVIKQWAAKTRQANEEKLKRELEEQKQLKQRAESTSKKASRNMRWAIVLAASMLFVSVFALTQFKKAKEAEIVAENQKTLAIEGKNAANYSYALALNEKANDAWNRGSREAAELYAAYALRYMEIIGVSDFPSESSSILASINNHPLDVKASTSTAPMKHRLPIMDIAISPDGKTFASASMDKTIRLWNAETSDYRVLKGHTFWVTSLAFSPSGSQLVSGSKDNTVRLWDLNSGNSTLLEGHGNEVSSVAFSPNGRQVLSSSIDGTVRLWDIESESSTIVIQSTIAGYYSDFLDDGRRIIWGDNSHLSISTISGEEITPIIKSSDQLIYNSLALTPDETQLALGLNDGRLRLVDMNSGNTRHFQGHTSGIKSIDFSFDGKMMITGSMDGTIRVWDMNSGESRILEGHVKQQAVKARFFPDNQRILSGSFDTTLRLWDYASASSRTFPFNLVAMSGNGQHALVRHEGNNSLETWHIDSDTFTPLPTILEKGEWISTARFSYSGEVLVINSTNNKNYIGSPAIQNSFQVILDSSPANLIAVSHDGNQIFYTRAVAPNKTTASLWDVRSSNSEDLFSYKTLQDNGIRTKLNAAFSPNGGKIAVSLNKHINSGAVLQWDLAIGKADELYKTKGKVYDLIYSPNGKVLASASEDKVVRLFNVESNTLKVLEGHEAHVLSVAFSQDGKQIVSGDRLGFLRLWDLNSSQVHILKSNIQNGINLVGFTKESSELFASNDLTDQKMWLGANLHQLNDYCEKIREIESRTNLYLDGITLHSSKTRKENSIVQTEAKLFASSLEAVCSSN